MADCEDILSEEVDLEGMDVWQEFLVGLVRVALVVEDGQELAIQVESILELVGSKVQEGSEGILQLGELKLEEADGVLEEEGNLHTHEV